MNFFADNYIWFIIAFIVVLMTIIGYIAEKTGFVKKDITKKEKSQKTNKEEEVVENIEPITLEATEEMGEPIEDVQFDEPFASDMEVNAELTNDESYNEPSTLEEQTLNEKSTEEIQFMNEDLNVPFGDGQFADVSNEDLNAPFGDTTFETAEASNEEDLSVPFGNDFVTEEAVAFKQNLADDSEFETISNEDLNVPFGDNVTEEKNNDLGLELPDINSVSSNITNTDESDSEEDIWKF